MDADRVDLDRVVPEKLSFFTREEDLLTVGRVRRSELVRAGIGTTIPSSSYFFVSSSFASFLRYGYSQIFTAISTSIFGIFSVPCAD